MLADMQPHSGKALLRHSPLFEGLGEAVLDEMLSHFRREGGDPRKSHHGSSRRFCFIQYALGPFRAASGSPV